MMFEPRPIDCVHSPDISTFVREIVPAHRPVVMRGLVADWPAVSAGRSGAPAMAEYLRAMDNGNPTTLFSVAPNCDGRFFYSDDMRGLNFTSSTTTLSELLDRLLSLFDEAEPPGLYAGATPAAQNADGFSKANVLPLPTPGGEPRIWVSNATKTATHYDGSNNVACVVAGTRRFILFPPEQLHNLYVGPVDRTPAGQPVSMVDPLNPDLGRYPQFAEAWGHAMQTELAPGDALFIPSFWWHHVTGFGQLNVLVNYWYRDGPSTAPLAAMMHAVASIRDLPQAEKDAWKEWFDRFVFSANASEALNHVPVHARGVLSAPSPARNNVIKAYLMKVLSMM